MASNSIPLSSYQIRLLAVLALINFVNFADRQVVVPLLPLLRQQMNVTDAQLGSLQTWLLVVLAVASIPCGFLADRWSRTRIITAGVVFWSLATIACGFASSFMLLLVARALIGVGEAAYAPAAQSMISDSFPYQRRAVAQSIFASGMLLGGAAGQAFGGVTGEVHGWKYTFIIIGLVCMLPALFVIKLPEPPRRPRSEVVPIFSLLAVPAYLAMIVAGTCITFASVSLLTWGIDFAVNYKEFSLREASLSIAVVALLSLLLGVLYGRLSGRPSPAKVFLRPHHRHRRRFLASPLPSFSSPSRLTISGSSSPPSSLAAFLCPGITAPSPPSCTTSHPSALTPLPSASTCSSRSFWAL